MKWEHTKQYSPQELNLMQQDAIERVRQMQRRSDQVLRRSGKPPSFFIPEEAAPLPVVEMPHPKEEASASSAPHQAKNATHYQQPTSSFHPTPPPAVQNNNPLNSLLPITEQAKSSVEKVLAALNLDHERLLILGLLFLLYNDGADHTLLLALLYLFM